MLRRGPFAAIRRVLRARDVFGRAVERDGVTVIPVASVFGGGGAGGGERGGSDGGVSGASGEPTQSGSGMGFGLAARPIGAFVISDGKTRWRPAVDVTGLAVVAMLSGLVLARWMLRDR